VGVDDIRPTSPRQTHEAPERGQGCKRSFLVLRERNVLHPLADQQFHKRPATAEERNIVASSSLEAGQVDRHVHTAAAITDVLCKVKNATASALRNRS
jgi:hypothetical protein